MHYENHEINYPKQSIILQFHLRMRVFRRHIRHKTQYAPALTYMWRQRFSSLLPASIHTDVVSQYEATTMTRSYGISFDPSIDAHPMNQPTPDFEVGDVVRILPYNGGRMIREDGETIGMERYLSDDANASEGPTWEVVEIDGIRWRGIFSPNNDPENGQWFPRDIVYAIDEETKREWEERREQRRQRLERVEARKNQDRDEVMQVCIAHARKVCTDVWPGGTVDPDEITWFWWKSSGSNTYGRCWEYARDSSAEHHGAEIVDPRKPAIGLNWSTYVNHGMDRMLQTVRHELVHAWQALHDNCNSIDHSQTFKQWCPDMGLEKKRHIEASH